MSGDGARIYRHMAKVADELSGKAQAARLQAVGDVVAKELAEAVRHTPVRSGSLSDLSLSAHGHPSVKTGWHRVDIKGAAKVSGSSFEVAPSIGKAWGPLRVLESGRQSYAAGDRRNGGQYFSKKRGVLVERKRKVKANVGAYEGKGTWSRARNEMARKAPRAFAVEVSKSIARAVKG